MSNFYPDSYPSKVERLEAEIAFLSSRLAAAASRLAEKDVQYENLLKQRGELRSRLAAAEKQRDEACKELAREVLDCICLEKQRDEAILAIHAARDAFVASPTQIALSDADYAAGEADKLDAALQRIAELGGEPQGLSVHPPTQENT